MQASFGISRILETFGISRLTRLPAAAAALLAASAATGAVSLDAASAARLEALQRAPESAGDLIYRGAVFDAAAPASSPLFSYERRVAPTPGGWRSAHVTTDTQGRTLIVEQAAMDTGYTLQRFDAVNAQLGYSGSVQVSADGRQLEYRLVENGRLSTATERVSDPVVSGPSLHGFILRHWDALEAGRSIPVRMIVLAKKQTYGFDIRRAATDARSGHVAFVLTPNQWLVRLMVAPLTVTFDAATRNVVRYEGRVPPMRDAGGRLTALDARVDYTMAAAYR